MSPNTITFYQSTTVTHTTFSKINSFFFLVSPEGIGSTIEEDTRGRLAIPASSTTLLIVVLHGLADGVMDDKSDVWLVYSHAKRHRCHNNLYKNNFTLKQPTQDIPI